MIEVRTDDDGALEGWVIGDIDPASQVGQDVAQDGRTGVGLNLDPRLVCTSVQAVDRVVDDPRDAYRRSGLVHECCIATDSDTAAGISGKDIVDDDRTWSQLAVVQGDHVANRSRIRTVARLGGDRNLTRLDRLRGNLIHVDESIAQIPRGWDQIDTVLGGSRYGDSRDDELPLISKNVRITGIFAPLGVLSVLDRAEAYRHWVAVGIAESEAGVSKQVRGDRAVELKSRRVGSVVKGSAEHIPGVLDGQSEQSTNGRVVDGISNRKGDLGIRSVRGQRNADPSGDIRPESRIADVGRGKHIEFERNGVDAIADGKGVTVTDLTGKTSRIDRHGFNQAVIGVEGPAFRSHEGDRFDGQVLAFGFPVVRSGAHFELVGTGLDFRSTCTPWATVEFVLEGVVENRLQRLAVGDHLTTFSKADDNVIDRHTHGRDGIAKARSVVQSAPSGLGDREVRIDWAEDIAEARSAQSQDPWVIYRDTGTVELDRVSIEAPHIDIVFLSGDI